MKIRNGFVSNSSSSSFIVPLAMLNETQLHLIENHGTINLPYAHQKWKITKDEHNLMGETWMNNFNMRKFIQDIGVPEDAVQWEGNDAERQYFDDRYH